MQIFLPWNVIFTKEFCSHRNWFQSKYIHLWLAFCVYSTFGNSDIHSFFYKHHFFGDMVWYLLHSLKNGGVVNNFFAFFIGVLRLKETKLSCGLNKRSICFGEVHWWLSKNGKNRVKSQASWCLSKMSVLEYTPSIQIDW